jgi:hypothetical protein
MMTNYSGSIALSKLVSAKMTAKGKDGKPIQGVFIPFDQNYITVKEDAIYLNVGVVIRDEKDQYGQDGFISHKMSSEAYKSLGKDKANEIKLPILGNIKNFAPAPVADTAGLMDDGSLTPDSELPF